MITEKDLQEAIAECEGQRKPTSNTCLKLAAFYAIKDHLYPQEKYTPMIERGAYNDSGNTEKIIEYESKSEFSQLINGRKASEIWEIIDDLMDALMAINPRLYNSVINKIK